MTENTRIGLVGTIERRDTTSTKHWLNISFETGESSREEGKIFVPLSQEQLEAIRKTGGNAKRTAELTIDRKKKLIKWIFFKPLGLPSKLSGPMEKQPSLRKGIGSLVHGAIVDYLHETHPDFSIQSSAITTTERRAQLAAMGIDHYKIYPISEYRRIVQAYLARKPK